MEYDEDDLMVARVAELAEKMATRRRDQYREKFGSEPPKELLDQLANESTQAAAMRSQAEHAAEHGDEADWNAAIESQLVNVLFTALSVGAEYDIDVAEAATEQAELLAEQLDYMEAMDRAETDEDEREVMESFGVLDAVESALEDYDGEPRAFQ